MKLFNRNRPASPLDVLATVPPSVTPIFARLAVEMPLPSWDDTEAVAA
ncbi:hypothetical protein GS479_24490 [Rhodococcus hoagii]|nr:hypothetical protein [Prescottella equi]NKR28515.1 hypothetical protein [Prescottella equi]NKR57980.1 hypothetical protein [Prescottella equi]NKR61674.1 hypothetical protein [Prescottella equi]NKS94647.1 hypothetical protein [Prescottella equi]